MTRVVLRHDNGTEFTAGRYLDTSAVLGIKLSRTAYRHPDGNAFVERVYRTYKEGMRLAQRVPVSLHQSVGHQALTTSTGRLSAQALSDHAWWHDYQ